MATVTDPCPLLYLYRNSLKRIARHDDQDCSKESILNMMDRFVKTVSVMDDTILIPSRLMDREVIKLFGVV